MPKQMEISIIGRLTNHCMYLQWYLELLRLFMQDCNFSDKFVSETRQKRLILSAGMDACHRFIFFGLSPKGINYIPACL